MDDEQVDADTVRGRQRGAHSEQSSVFLAALRKGQIDFPKVAIDPIEQVARFFLVNLESPLGRLLEKFHAGGDRHLAGDFARGHSSHSISDDH